METIRQSILQKIKDNLPLTDVSGSDIDELSILSDFGVDSLHLITMLLELQQHYPLDISSVASDGMPVTVGDLVSLVDRGSKMHATGAP